MQFYLIEEDRLPVLQTQLSDSIGYVDVTSGTPVFYWRLRSHASGLHSGIGTVIGSPSSGLVEYDWTTGDTAYPGVYVGRWKVNYSGGFSETFPNDSYIIFEFGANL